MIDINKVLQFFENDDLAAKVWHDKYALKDQSDKVVELSPIATFTRIAQELSRIESKYPNPILEVTIMGLLNSRTIVPGGSGIHGIGNNNTYTTLSNCYVVESPADSYGGILKTDQELVQLMKRRGGVGIDISTLSPKGTPVNNSAKTTTGVVSFMNRYSNSTKEVAQEGRRGALILTIEATHPDILEYISSKDDLTKITGANISVKLSDDFMNCVEDDKEVTLFHPKGGEPVKIKARVIWDKIVHQAWKSAEPGVLFWDRIIDESPADSYSDFNTISVNPCGELPLCAYDSCRLMHVNMFKFVENPFTPNARFNAAEYAYAVEIAQRMMDNVIDLEVEKIDKIINKIKKDPESDSIKRVEYEMWLTIRSKLTLGRRTGLNPWLGLADTLAALNIKYGSKESISFVEEVGYIGCTSTYISSIKLADERGPFPLYDSNKDVDNLFLKRLDFEGIPRRNISCLTVPPSGTVAIILRISSGIEPVFNLYYTRKRRVSAENENKTYRDENGEWWEESKVIHPKFETWYSVTNNMKPSEARNYLKSLNSKALDEIIKESPYHGSTANEIDPLSKVELQSTLQKYVDHSISITYNLPKTVTEKEVSDIYFKAWKSGCKGITIYREGSRDGVLTNTERARINRQNAPKRPRDLQCDIFTTKVLGEEFVVIVGLMDGLPYEVFSFRDNKISIKHGVIRKIKSGKYNLLDESGEICIEDITSKMEDPEEDRARLISTALRHGTDMKHIVEQLVKSKSSIVSFSKAVSRVLKRYIEHASTKKSCPQCDHNLTIEGGCEVCNNCGFSECE